MSFFLFARYINTSSEVYPKGKISVCEIHPWHQTILPQGKNKIWLANSGNNYQFNTELPPIAHIMKQSPP